MKSLNEKLAVEVMGWTSDGGYNYFSETKVAPDWSFHEEKGDRGLFVYPAIWWNPTQDLNQLRECYLAAEKDNPIVFWAMYWSELKKLFSSSLIEEDAHCATAWVKHPELVAQAILKAKGVE